jgi:hypothetical protein
MVSLERLMQAGLSELYPEFEDPGGRKQWTNRVRDLRQMWSAEQGTTDREIDLALAIANTCFSQFNEIDIASALLTFKNRKLSKSGKWPIFVAGRVPSEANASKPFPLRTTPQSGRRSRKKFVDTGLRPRTWNTIMPILRCHGHGHRHTKRYAICSKKSFPVKVRYLLHLDQPWGFLVRISRLSS